MAKGTITWHSQGPSSRFRGECRKGSDTVGKFARVARVPGFRLPGRPILPRLRLIGRRREFAKSLGPQSGRSPLTLVFFRLLRQGHHNGRSLVFSPLLPDVHQPHRLHPPLLRPHVNPCTSEDCESQRDARTDDHAARASPRPRNVARDLRIGNPRKRCSKRTGRARRAGCSTPRPRRWKRCCRRPSSSPARSPGFISRTSARPRLAEPGGADPRNPAPGGRSRAGRSPGPAHDRVGVSDAGSPCELVARPRFARPERDREAPRRGARLSAGAQPAVAIRRSRDVPPGREQAEPGLPVRLSGHVRQRPDAAGQGEARTPGPGASAVRRGAEPRGDAQPPAPDFEGRRILGIDSTTRRFRGDLSPPRVVAEGSVRVPQGDPALRIERTDRAGARLVERPEADPAPRQREDRFEEFGGHRRRCDAGVLRRREPRRRNAQPGRDRPVARSQRRPDPAEGEVGRGRSREAEGSPGALEGRRAGRSPGGHLVLRRDAPPLRGEPRQGGRGRERGGDSRMVGPDRRRRSWIRSSRACVLRRPGRRRPLPS